jgi:hypothetical protein
MRAIIVGVMLVGCGASAPHNEVAVEPTARHEGTRPAPARDQPGGDRDLATVKAMIAAERAIAAAQQAQDMVDQLSHDLEALNARLDHVIDAVVAAQTNADRATARVTLEGLRREQAELNALVKAAKAAANRDERLEHDEGTPAGPDRLKRPERSTILKGIPAGPTGECVRNPLAKGCT